MLLFWVDLLILISLYAVKCTVTFYLTWRHISAVKEAVAKSGLLFWLNLAKAKLMVKW